MTPTQITLVGAPISANHMWRSSVAKGTGRPFTYMPTEAKNMREFWRMTALNQLRKQGKKMIEDSNEIGVDIKFFFETKARRDIDNFLKVVIDSMTGVVYKDDSQIRQLHAEKLYDPGSPRIEIIIT